MKKLILIIIVIFGINIANAQTEAPIENWINYVKSKNIYFKDVNNLFNKFLGTWEYNNGNQYFKITFYKQIKTFDGNYQYSDRIYSHFLYQYNGNTIYDTYPPGGISATPYFSYIDGSKHVVVNNNKLLLFYNEPSTTGCDRTKRGEVNLEHQYQGQVPQLIWERTDFRVGKYDCPQGTTPDTSAFQIPANMTLTKVN